MSTAAQRHAAKNARKAKKLKEKDQRRYDAYKRGLKIRDQNILGAHRDAEQAGRERAAGAKSVRGIYDKAGTDAARQIAAIERQAAADDKAIMTRPRTQYTGAAWDVPNPIPVWHWRLGLSTYEAARLGLGDPVTRPAGALIGMLPQGGGVVENVVDEILRQRPDLAEVGAFLNFARAAAYAWTADVQPALTLLEYLRDIEWWRELCESAGVTLSTTDTVQNKGRYCGLVEQKVTTVYVPSLHEVAFTDAGLELVFASVTGDSPERWTKAVPVLRGTLKQLGLKADGLAVRESPDGGVVLALNDAKTVFPKAIAPEPPERPVATVDEARLRYRDAEWVMGVDARGNWLTYPLADQPHALIVGGTGGGKSVWLRTQIELFRTGYADPRTGEDTGGGWRFFIASGKPSDFAGLEGLPGVQLVAVDTAQVVVMLQTVKGEMERRVALAAQSKREGRGDSAFDFPPLLLVLDEFGFLGLSINEKYGSKGLAWFRDLVDSLLRVARETRIHVVLSSQTVRKDKSDPASVPGSWQGNIQLKVSLGNPDDSETLNNAFGSATREQAALIGPRLVGHRGRGMTGDEISKRVIEFQSLYGWSPGTTSLAPGADPKVAPPTTAVRQAWERWEPVSASVPWLAPRLGIEVENPDWREGDLREVAQTPVIPITDRTGAVKPGLERYDHLGPVWAGAEQLTGGGVSLDFDDDDDGGLADPAAGEGVLPPAADDTAPAAPAESEPTTPATPATPKRRTTRRPTTSTNDAPLEFV